MLNQIKKLAGETIIYGLSTVISSLLNIILIPIYTRVFLPADYGIINLVNVTFILLYILVVFGMDNSTALWYWKYEADEERNKTFANWAFFQLFAASLISLILICSSSFFSVGLTGIPDYHLLLIIAALNFPLWSFQKVVNMWYRLKRKAWGAVFFALFTTLFTLIFSIVYVVKYRFGIIGVFYAQLSASLLAFIFAVYTMRSIFRPRNFDLARLKKMLAFSFPLVPAAICTWVLSSAGSYFIKYIKGTGEVGLFQIGVNIASLGNIIISAFLQAWSPFALSIHKQDNHKKVYSSIFSLYGIVGSIVVCGIFIFAYEILTIFTTPQYYHAYWVAGIFSVNILIAGVAQITSIGCNIRETNVPYGVAVILGSVLAVVLFMLLIPFFGKEGAAAATLFSNMFIAWFLSRKAQRLYPIPYDFESFILIISLLIGISVVANYTTNHLDVGVRYLIKSLFFIGYITTILLYYTYVKKIFLVGIFLKQLKKA